MKKKTEFLSKPIICSKSQKIMSEDTQAAAENKVRLEYIDKYVKFVSNLN